MKRNIFIIMLAAMGLTACFVTTPVTTPRTNTVVVSQPATVVTTPNTVVKSNQTVYVSSTSDLSYNLDLQAVAIAFAEARTMEEFEWYLNDYSRQISNLDLNRDGYVDYLRVVEQISNGTHIIIIQDVYALNAYQDVATIVVENNYYTQVIGHPYIYGKNYILEPTFVTRPPVYGYYGHSYNPWTSPYYWNHYPNNHQYWAPKPQQTYYSHIDIYITNHYYCSNFGYATTYHYTNYPNVYQNYQRNDYGRQNPNQSFDYRSSTINNGNRAANASQLSGTRNINNTRTASTRSSNTSASTRAASTSSNSSATRNNSTATRSNTSSSNTRGTVTTTSRTANSTTTTTSRTSGSTTRSNSTTRTTQGDVQTTTNTRVTSSPTRTKTTTTTTTQTPTSTSNRRVTTTTSTDKSTGQSSTRSNTTERIKATNTRTATTRSSAAPSNTSTRSSSSSSSGTSTRSSSSSSSSSNATRTSSSNASNTRSGSTRSASSGR